MNLTEKLLAVRAEVDSAKLVKAAQIAETKAAFRQANSIRSSAFRNSIANDSIKFNALGNDAVGASAFSNLGEEALSAESFSKSNPSVLLGTSPVVGTNAEGATIHENGTFSVTDRFGKNHVGLDEVTANRFKAYTDTDAAADAAGASDNEVINKVGQLFHGGLDVLEMGAQAFTGKTTLNEKVISFNEDNQEGKLTSFSQPAAEGSDISPTDIENYRRIIKADKDLTPTDIEFQKTDKYKTITRLDSEAAENVKDSEVISGAINWVKKITPVNRKEQAASDAAMKTVAKNSGDLESMIYAVTNDLGTHVARGFDSTLFMVALTYGGPVTQLGTLLTLAKGKSQQAIKEYTLREKKDPSAEVVNRIKIASTVGMIVEKGSAGVLADMLPGRATWMKKVATAVAANTPAKILNLAAVKPISAFLSEAVSGGLTEITDQYGQSGAVPDISSVKRSAFNEAIGMPGGLTGLYATNVAAKIAKNIVSPTAPTEAEENRADAEDFLEEVRLKIESNDPITVGDTPAGNAGLSRLDELNAEIKAAEDSNEEAGNPKTLQNIAERDLISAELATELTPEESTAHKDMLRRAHADVVAQLDKLDNPPTPQESKANQEISDKELKDTLAGMDPADREDQRTTLRKLIDRVLTGPQTDILDKALRVFRKAEGEKTQEKPKVDNMRSFMEQNPEELEKLKEVSPEDTDLIEAQIKVKETEELLSQEESNQVKELGEVHTDVTVGTMSSRWTGLKTYADAILKVITEESEASIADPQVKVLEDAMEVHAANLEKKLIQFKSALNMPSKKGQVIVVKGSAVTGSVGRVMRYSEPTYMDEAAYIKLRSNGDFINAIDPSNSAALIATLSREVDYSKELLTVVLGYKDSQFAENSSKITLENAAITESLDEFSSSNIKLKTDPLTSEGISEATLETNAPVPVPASTTSAPAQETSISTEEIVSDTDANTDDVVELALLKARKLDLLDDIDTAPEKTVESTPVPKKVDTAEQTKLTKDVDNKKGLLTKAKAELKRIKTKIAELSQSSKYTPKLEFDDSEENALFNSGADSLTTRDGDAPFENDLQRLIDDPAFANTVLQELLLTVEQDVARQAIEAQESEEAQQRGEEDFGITEDFAEEGGTDEKAAIAVLEKLLASRSVQPSPNTDIQKTLSAAVASANAASKALNVAQQALTAFNTNKEPNVQSNASAEGSSPATDSAPKEQTTNVRSGTQTTPSTTGVSTEGGTTGRDSTSQTQTSTTQVPTNPIEPTQSDGITQLSEEIDAGEGFEEPGSETSAEQKARLEGDLAASSSVRTPVGDRVKSNINSTGIISFIDQALVKFPTVITEAAFEIWATAKAIADGKTLEQVKNSNREFQLNVIGKSFSDLVEIKAAQGIQALPDAAFLPGNLVQALIDLGTKKESAVILAAYFETYNKRYQKISIDGNDTKKGNFAVGETLSILHRDGVLPAQVIFGMMIGTLNWVHQTPDNVVFPSKMSREMFMYGGNGTLSPDEEIQLMGNNLLGAKRVAPLGHSYQDVVQRIGIDIANILKMSAKKIPLEASINELVEGKKAVNTEAYFDNLKLAFGLGALQIGTGDISASEQAGQTNAIPNDPTAFFQIQAPHIWKFVDKDSDTRTFTHGRKYKHIKMSDYSKISLEGNAAIADLTTVIGADLDTDSKYPLQEKSPTVVKFINNSFGNVPEKVRTVLKSLQAVIWTAAETLDTVSALYTDHQDTLNGIMEVIPTTVEDHEVEHARLTASNSDKTNALKNIMEALADKKLTRFFFRYKLQVQHRIMMQGKINPQNSKVSRFLLRSFASKKYTADNIFLFQLSVAANMGFSIDKNRSEAAVTEFNRIIADPNVIAAVNAIINIKEEGRVAELATLLPLIKATFGGNMSMLNALTALSKYMPVKDNANMSFTSDAILEIDGISNGAAINVLQFPIFNNIKKVLGQGGTYYGEDTKHDPTKPGVYEDLVTLIKKFSSAKYNSAYAADSSVVHDPDSINIEGPLTKSEKIYEKKNNALMELFTDLKDGNLRDLVKYPFLIFLYGGQPKSISEGVAKEIIADLYSQLSAMQHTYNSAEGSAGKLKYKKEVLVPFLDNLDLLGGFSSQTGTRAQLLTLFTKAKLANKPGGQSQTFHFNDAVLKQSIAGVVKPRFDFGLNGMLGGTNAARQSVIKGVEVLHAIFEVNFKRAYNAKLATYNGVRTGLTKREIDDLVNDPASGLRDLLPQSSGPLSDSLTFTDLSKRKNRKDGNNALETSQFTYKKSNGKQGTAESTGTQNEFTLPGVSALIRQIINMDSAALTMTLQNDPLMLMLHDAFMASPEQLVEASRFYGIEHLRLNKQHSVIGSTLARLDKVIGDSSPEILEEANSWLKENGFSNKRITKEALKESITNVVDDLREVNIEVQKARDEIYTVGSTEGLKLQSQQLFIPPQPEQSSTTFVEEQKHLVEESVKVALDESDTNVVDTDPNIDTELKKKIKDSFGSLSDIPRENPEPVTGLIGDITPSTVNLLFDKLRAVSSNYYADTQSETAHSNILAQVLKELSKGLKAAGDIHLSTEQIDSITHGNYEALRQDMRISVSRFAPVSANGMSPQEVYVHEMVHAMVSKALAQTPLLRKKVERLFQQVKADIASNGGYRIFLGDIANPSAADIAAAKAQYLYIFNNNDNEEHRLDEFLAFAVTNRALTSYLSNITTRRRVRNPGLMGELMKVLDLIVQAFERILNKSVHRSGKTDSFHEMLTVVEHLVAIQSKHESGLQKFNNKTYKFLDDSDQKLRQFIAKQGKELKFSPTDSRVRKIARSLVGMPGFILSENAQVLQEQQKVHQLLNQTLRGIASEIGNGVLSPALIEQLLHSKVNISKARQEQERSTIKWFDGIWKSLNAKQVHAMPVETRVALTNILLRTDVSSLRAPSVGLSTKAITELFGNSRSITVEKLKLRKLLGNLAPNHPALMHAEELGEFIVTRNVNLRNGHMNSYTLAHEHLQATTETQRELQIELLDAYATLTALQYTDSREREIVSELSINEFAQNPDENGIIDMLDSHLAFKDKSLVNLFSENRSQLFKGWIIERLDDLTSMKTGTVADKKNMKKAGFSESVPLGKIIGVNQTHDTLYITRNMHEVADASGIMSTTNHQNMGTTLREIFSKDPKFQDPEGHPIFTDINKAIKTFIKEESLRAKSVRRNRDFNLRPVRDGQRRITDYRVMISTATKEKLLKPDMEIQNVFAHMQSSYIDRVNTITSDIETVKILVREQSDLLLAQPELFIDFLNPKSPYIDRYRKLPRQVREYMDKFAVDGKFMVRLDIIEKVFGYKVKDASQLPFLQSENMIEYKRFAGFIHYLIREIVGYGKDRIVIAMPQVIINNIHSNIAQLTMKKIPLSYTAYKILEGYTEYKRYRDDTEERDKLKHRKSIKKLSDTSPEAIQIRALEIRIKNNKIHRMSLAGVNSLIVEDINDAQIDGYVNRLRRGLKAEKYAKHLNKVPTVFSDVAAVMFMSKSSAPYQLSRKVVQMTDFLGRYVMIEHATQVRNIPFPVAMHDSLNALVLFDETLAPALEALDAIGATSFLSYFLRNQRASRQLVHSSPTGVGISAAIQYATGIPTLGNLNSAWVTGDIKPNVMQLDDLWDEANNVTGADLIAKYFKDVFG